MTSLAVQANLKGPGASYASFAAFGMFWGTWGASIPRIRDQSVLTDGQLGTALLFIGAGALPAMLLTGRLLDRFGIRMITAAALILQAAAGFCVAVTATGMTRLCLALLLVGASSGAADVAINAGAGHAEREARKPVITRSHGTFSALVVCSSLLTGVLNGFDAPPAVSFTLVAAAMAAAAVYVLFALPSRPQVREGAPAPEPDGAEADRDVPAPNALFPVLPVVLVGFLGALALAGENAHQSWAAVFFEDILHTGADLSSTAPAMFAAVAAITRFSTGRLNPDRATRTVLLGAAAAAVGAGLIAGSTTVAAALAGLTVAAAGTAVLYPTLLGIVSRTTSGDAQGRATSLLATMSYLGFLLGPVYVGLWADAAGLRGAMIAVAALGVVLVFLAPKMLRPTLHASAPGNG
ncbi:MFS transporter [Arthrobacter zhaoxinii]|uniref:MFS transporter n=1 Tax=Arthrobacter zhaoxinii TaxID=2964616 RepID=A0ABY5YTL9_9MICC|nr:MFS transporter [Arthrobacter zhaoxinii]UWX98440.1 MFS transporter [Arthrobacter zhaoxinii]